MYYSTEVRLQGNDLLRRHILSNNLDGLKSIVAQKYGLPLTADVIDKAREKYQYDASLHNKKLSIE